MKQSQSYFRQTKQVYTAHITPITLFAGNSLRGNILRSRPNMCANLQAIGHE